MKKTITKYLIFTAIILFSIKGMAQQDPLFTHYMYNMSVINPGYATEDPGILNTGAIYRSQWQNVNGAPSTANIFAHTPVSERVEMGLTVVHDNVGDIVRENNITADFAYVLPATETAKLSFGIKAGLSTFDANLSGLELTDPSDPAFENVNETFPVFGVGAFWYEENYYIGASAPNLFTSKYVENEQGLSGIGKEEIHFYLTGGYVYDLNPDVKLKPAFMLRGVSNAPLSVDVTANVLLYDKLEAGLGYRIDNSITGLVNFRITPELRVGYAYDHFTSDFANYNMGGTHEIMVLFDVDLFGLTESYDKSPRFF